MEKPVEQNLDLLEFLSYTEASPDLRVLMLDYTPLHTPFVYAWEFLPRMILNHVHGMVWSPFFEELILTHTLFIEFWRWRRSLSHTFRSHSTLCKEGASLLSIRNCDRVYHVDSRRAYITKRPAYTKEVVKKVAVYDVAQTEVKSRIYTRTVLLHYPQKPFTASQTVDKRWHHLYSICYDTHH